MLQVHHLDFRVPGLSMPVLHINTNFGGPCEKERARNRLVHPPLPPGTFSGIKSNTPNIALADAVQFQVLTRSTTSVLFTSFMYSSAIVDHDTPGGDVRLKIRMFLV